MDIAIILTTTVFDFGHVHQSVDTHRLTVPQGRHNAVALRYASCSIAVAQSDDADALVRQHTV